MLVWCSIGVSSRFLVSGLYGVFTDRFIREYVLYRLRRLSCRLVDTVAVAVVS